MLRLFVVVLASWFGTRLCTATDVFVDPSLKVNGNGSHEEPFNSIPAAIEGIRAYRAAHPDVDESIRMHLSPGIYEISNTITLSGIDSGVPGGPVVFSGPVHGEAKFIGGVIVDEPLLNQITNESTKQRLPTDEAREMVRVLDLSSCMNDEMIAALAGPVHRGMGTSVKPIASEVFWNGRALTRARWPNDGFATVSAIVDPGSIPRKRADDIPENERETGPDRGGVFRFEDPDRMQRWADAGDPWAFGYWHWDWADEQLPIESIDSENGEIQLGLPHRYGLRDAARFYITNLLEEIDTPGEYYIDVAARHLYIWPPDDGGALSELMISLTNDPLIHIEDASNLTFSNIVFEGTRGSALVAEDCSNVTVRGCTFHNIGTRAVEITGTTNRFEGNVLHAIGAQAITIRGGDRPTLTPAGNEVIGNHIHDFGRVYRTYQPAVGLSGVGQRVAHNRIHNAPHSAIMFSGNDHVIEYNEIFDVLRETGDCGAIYCGRDWTLHGTVIRHNFFHHLKGTSNRYQNAVYLDDMASGIQVVGNVFYDCHWGMLVGGGRDNLIRGNVFIGGDMAISFDARGVGWMAKHIADPSTSTLHRNLQAVPYDQPPWNERFPELQSYLTDRFGRPVGSTFVGNVIVNTKLGRVDDRECVRVEGNAIVTQPLERFFVDPEADPHAIRFREAVLEFDAVDEFIAIPVADIGIQPFERDR